MVLVDIFLSGTRAVGLPFHPRSSIGKGLIGMPPSRQLRTIGRGDIGIVTECFLGRHLVAGSQLILHRGVVLPVLLETCHRAEIVGAAEIDGLCRLQLAPVFTGGVVQTTS